MPLFDREFTNLTLPLPETSARVNLRDCFHELLKEEVKSPKIGLILSPHPSFTFRGSMSSIASSARDLDPIQRRSTSSSSPLFLSSTFQGSIKKGYTPGGSLIPIAMSNKIIFNSCWSSYGRSPFRLTCTESFENAFLNEI